MVCWPRYAVKGPLFQQMEVLSRCVGPPVFARPIGRFCPTRLTPEEMRELLLQSGHKTPQGAWVVDPHAFIRLAEEGGR